MSNPTPKQKRILDYLKEFIDKHGRPPTLEEIARRFRLRSLSTVHAHLAKLREKDWIARDANTARGFRLTDKALGIHSRLIPVAGYVMPDGTIGENTDGASMVDVITELAGNEQAFALRIHGAPLPGSGFEDGDLIIAQESDDPTGRELVIAEVDGRTRLTTSAAHDAATNDGAETPAAVQAVVTGMLRTYERKET